MFLRGGTDKWVGCESDSYPEWKIEHQGVSLDAPTKIAYPQQVQKFRTGQTFAKGRAKPGRLRLLKKKKRLKRFGGGNRKNEERVEER